MMICEACSRHFQHEIEGVSVDDLIETSESVEVWTRMPGRNVEEQAQGGCEICARLCTALSYLEHLFLPGTDGHQIPLQSQPQDVIESIDVNSWVQFQPVALRFKFQLALTVITGEIQLDILPHDAENEWPLTHPIGNRIDNASCFRLFSTALSACLQSHETCRQSYVQGTDAEGTEGWIPSRLVQVDASLNLRLVERGELQERNQSRRVEYFTLSHVWGTEKFMTLTTQNITRLKKQIQFTEIPKCFQEAVTATRRLGGQYLWIDSLCIMQDSPQDWVVESGSMHRVYSNGICNLAASNQSISDRGLFCTRDPADGVPFTVDTFWGDEGCPEKVDLYPNFADVFTCYGPLYGRAWVAQERQLSPRTIHMAPFPVWECRQVILTENFPLEEPSDRPRCLYIQNKLVLDRDEMELLGSWYMMILSYSRCGLTKDDDRLIALSGIAKAFSKSLGSKYLAGIWEKYLIEGLLWATVDLAFQPNIPRRLKTKRYKEYVAPSWSWASLKGEIFLLAITIDKPLVEVVSTEIQPRDGDPFGQLCGGRLKLRGVLFEFPRVDDILCDIACNQFGDRAAVNLDDYYMIDYCYSDTWYLPLAVAPTASEHSDLDICGIILQKVSGTSGTAVYKRIGHAVVSHDGDIAGFGWSLWDWTSLPWDEDDYSVIEII